jgi:DNA (cytosine-5)-methyltransferase 1
MLTNAPIFGDIRLFIDQGYASGYSGLVDIVSAGFPCQPFSVAGKRKHEDDERNMWPATIEVIRIIRPREVWLENVPGLLSAGKKYIIIALEKIRQTNLFGKDDTGKITGRLIRHVYTIAGMRYFGRVLGDLSESGYNAKWKIISAAEVGAPHKRDRLWILADTPKQRIPGCESPASEFRRSRENLANSASGKSGIASKREGRESPRGGGKVFDSERERDISHTDGGRLAEADIASISGIERELGWASDSRRKRWPTEPELGRVADGVANRVERLEALGNGQVPRLVKFSYGYLKSFINFKE